MHSIYSYNTIHHRDVSLQVHETHNDVNYSRCCSFFPGAPSSDLSTMSLTKHYCLHIFCLADIAAAGRFVSSGRRAQRAKRRSSPCWRRAVGRSTNTRRRRRTGRRGEETTNTSSLDSSPTARKRSTSNSHATPRYRLEASLSLY